MADNDISTMAHLLRRAGFGATRDELEAYVAKGYEATVEELIHPENQPDVDHFLMERYIPEYGDLGAIDSNQQAWVYRLINTKRPFQEKMALFWHGMLCTGHSKVDHARMSTFNIDLYRYQGLGNFKDLLLELSRLPAMVYYLDNVENHGTSVNENYGRELLELFSLGVGMDGEVNYTEDDVKPVPAPLPDGTSNPPFLPSPGAEAGGGSAMTRRTTITTRRPSSGRQDTGTARISSK